MGGKDVPWVEMHVLTERMLRGGGDALLQREGQLGDRNPRRTPWHGRILHGHRAGIYLKLNTKLQACRLAG